MPDDSLYTSPSDILLPNVSALAVQPGRAALCSADGEIEDLTAAAAQKVLSKEPLLTCHTYFMAQRVGLYPPPPWPLHFDVLELFAFVRPAQFCLPTPAGLARALGLDAPKDMVDAALLLPQAAEALLRDLARPTYPNLPEARRTAQTMAQAGWPWGEAVLAALGADRNTAKGDWSTGLDVWNRLDDWQERAPEGEPGTQGVGEEEARDRLQDILGSRGEIREAQAGYASAASHCFQPREKGGSPHVLLAEAGTGIGKTAGYIAPASLWADKNGPAVWISTYTKNLQRQIDQELAYLYPDPVEKAQKVVVRKGRENYLCLLNLQELIGGNSGGGPRGSGGTLIRSAIALGLIARWARYSRDGDMVGGDFPAWLTPILTQNPARVSTSGIQAAGLTDRRGECIYSACPHYRKCFIEKAVRKSRHAHIVIANHALVMNQASLEFAMTSPVVVDDPLGLDPSDTPKKREIVPEFRRHFIFDEGHHLFDAADNTFSPHLTGYECADLRRWIRGPEGGGRGRGRGLLDRVGDLTGDHQRTEELLRETIRAARFLSGPGSLTRVVNGTPQGPAEGFFALVHKQVTARAAQPDSPFDLETDIDPLVDGLLEEAQAFAKALIDLARPMMALAKALADRLEDEAEDLDTNTRGRIDSAVRGLERRAKLMVPSWVQMLQSLGSPTPEEFVDWFGVVRAFGRDADVGMYRHWLDPTIPFAAAVLEPSQGALITSATLCDHKPAKDGEDFGDDWQTAEIRTGATHLPVPAGRAHFKSPFDYKAQSRVLVVTDVGRNSIGQVAAAYRALFAASGGGALGLFTAISRLRAVYNEIAQPLQTENIALYAQHVDAMDTGTLVDLFRAEEHACLLGTDAVRDGVDVPGASLRLLVFDRVPWPRPSILHKARRKAHGNRGYDDLITRLRLKQAFGRLIRKAGDHGVFVMLDGAMPSRLASAFPEEVEIERVGLAEAVTITREFLDR
ncbi:MAG: ATP-dependent DNA helicase [Alphaproteobacteria bacterium]|nr:MAG: ATP-dependent DNA helicase [Alphaproteobacteria bacterium]